MNMKRPGDQAKLLFLYLLRSSAALATEQPPKQFGTAAASVVEGHVALRLARRSDVSSIQRCNLATLPENYSNNFYVQHLRQWPDLALVAEYSSGDDSKTKKKRQYTHYLLGGYNGMTMAGDNGSNSEIVGYVLGKVGPSNNNDTPSSTLSDRDEPLLRPHVTSTESSLGHVTSLAVISKYRRKGLAAQLMTQLHHHMRTAYTANAVGLHVRVSNTAAHKLYCDGLGYQVVNVIPQYYQDGEDAYFMRKDFPQQQQQQDDDDIITFDQKREMKRTKKSLSDLMMGRSNNTNDNGGGIWNGWNLNLPESSRTLSVTPKELRLPRIVYPLLEDGSTVVGKDGTNEKSGSMDEKRMEEGDGALLVLPESREDDAFRKEYEPRSEQQEEQIMTGSL